VGREYIHDSKKGVMRSQFHLTRALVDVGFPKSDLLSVSKPSKHIEIWILINIDTFTLGNITDQSESSDEDIVAPTTKRKAATKNPFANDEDDDDDFSGDDQVPVVGRSRSPDSDFNEIPDFEDFEDAENDLDQDDELILEAGE
jgi:hypothetical protein